VRLRAEEVARTLGVVVGGHGEELFNLIIIQK
jgi:hypothetical protein